MHGPNGKAFENVGVFLEVESVKRLVTTDVVRPGWIPNGRASMSAEVFFEPTGEMRTRYAACAWHWDQAAQNEHEAMEGWGEAPISWRRLPALPYLGAFMGQPAPGSQR